MDFPPRYWSRLERMFAFAGALAEGGPAPYYGDADDGYVLDLGDPPSDIGAWMQVGAALVGGGALERWAVRPSETVHWLSGTTPESRRRDVNPVADSDRLVSTAFEDAGLFLLQTGSRRRGEQVSVVFDCGELGFGSLAAHGHADALSIVVRAGGAELLVDPGTYDYFTFPEWRRYFRGTAAHNTVAVDNLDQSELQGLFLWGRRANARAFHWRPSPDGGIVAGEHDGYRRLQDPVTCRRTVALDRHTITITDEVLAKQPHDVTVAFHLAADCDAKADRNCVDISFAAGRARLWLDDRFALAMSRGGETPQSGWVSSGYHRRSPAWIVTGAMKTDGPATLTTRLEIVELK